MPVVTAVPNPNEPNFTQLSDGNGLQGGGGTKISVAPGDLTSIFGATPIAQPSGAGQAAFPMGAPGLGNSAGALTHYSVSLTPTAVAANTVAEQTVTVTGVLATDMVIVNKPTSQAGLALVSGRVSAANTVALAFLNSSAASITPTAAQTYIVTTVPSDMQMSAVLSPAAVAANAVVEQMFTVPGLAVGQLVQVNKPSTNAGLALLSARASAPNTLAITYANATAAVITPTANETYEILALNGLVAASQVLEFGLSAAGMASVGAATTAEQTITEAGILANDIPIGASKPSLQAGLGLLTGRVSAAATYKATFVNASAGAISPTTAETYGVTVFRPSPAAPMSTFTASLVPGAVAAATTAEQTFVVPGLVAGQPVAVSPNAPVAAGGVGFSSARVSATNTLALTFVNVTAVSFTPPAFTATVAQFNQTTPTAGNWVAQLVSPLQTVGVTLMNALRSALVNFGLIAGA